MFSPNGRTKFSPRQVFSPKIGPGRAVPDDGFLVDLELDPAHQNMRSVTLGDHSLPSAEEVRVGIVPSSINKRKALLIGALITIVLVFAILIPVGVARMNKTSEDGVTVDSSSSSRFQETITYLLDYVDHTSLSTQGSPQFRAAEWMADDDPQNLPLEQGGRFLQRYALVVFYYATQGTTTWRHQLDFLTNNHECDWNYKVDDVIMGAICNDDLVVEQLVIDNTGLTGTLPQELYMLKSLARLVLPRNNLYGSLPEDIQEITTLYHLNLESNEISQRLPAWIGNLRNLEQLVLSNNNFYGDIPNEFERLEELELLSLENNGFTGSLDVLGLLQELKHVYLENNQFTGTVDKHWMTTLINVQTLDVSSNLLEGGVPSQLLLLPKLQVLDLHNNNLEGTLGSVSLEQDSTSLRFLSLFNNRMSGTIPASLQKFAKLEHLDLSNNRFQGPIPPFFASLTELTYLFLSDNVYLDEGPIPDWIQNLTNLRQLSMRNSGRVGLLPKWFDNLKQLQLLNLGENGLTGTIPASLGYASSLEYLLLNRNDLDGTMPKELNQLDNLAVLMLDKNSLHGSADDVCDLNLQVYTTDCHVPEIVCTCCSECCSDEDESCNADNTLANYRASFERGYIRDGYYLEPEQFVPAN